MNFYDIFHYFYHISYCLGFHRRFFICQLVLLTFRSIMLIKLLLADCCYIECILYAMGVVHTVVKHIRKEESSLSYVATQSAIATDRE